MSDFQMADYVDVAERIRLLREKHPGASLRGGYEIAEVNGITHVVYRAECYRSADDPTPGIGFAWEQVPGRTPFTRGSELMNAETSAWGRAIVASLAADTKRVASADEISNAPDYATADDRRMIAAAMRDLPMELRASLAAELKEEFGPPETLLVAHVDEVLYYISEAREGAAPFETAAVSPSGEETDAAVETREGGPADSSEDEKWEGQPAQLEPLNGDGTPAATLLPEDHRSPGDLRVRNEHVDAEVL